MGGGVPPPTVGSFFIFRLENVQSGAYLRRKFRLDDMYYMGKPVTIRPTGKRVFFLRTRKHIYENMHPKIIFAKFQNTCQRYYTKYYCTCNINMNEVPRRRNEGTKRTSIGEDVMRWGCHSKAPPKAPPPPHQYASAPLHCIMRVMELPIQENISSGSLSIPFWAKHKNKGDLNLLNGKNNEST